MPLHPNSTRGHRFRPAEPLRPEGLRPDLRLDRPSRGGPLRGPETPLMAASTEPRAETRAPGAPARGPAGWHRLCLGTGAVVVVFALILTTGAGGSGFGRVVSNVGLCFAAIAAAVACLWRAARFTGR